MPSVILRKGKERRIIAGHPWVYAGEIERVTGEPPDGSAVEIRDHKDRFLGRGLCNSHSQIAVRRFSTDKNELDEAFFLKRLETAIRHRAQFSGLQLQEPGAVGRVVFSEADLLPGLILDKYGDHLVLQALTLGIDQRKEMIAGIAQKLFDPVAIVERSDVHTRKLEGLAETTGFLYGIGKAELVVELAGVKFAVRLREDQKTGLYLDQAENYRYVAAWAKGRKVLDCFSCQGGFALAAAKAGAASVTAIDISEDAVARAQENARLNELTGHVQFHAANAFDVLKQYDTEKRQFDLIILDPPSFTRSRQNVDDALRGYKEINLRALKMLPPGGLLATFTCSHHISLELFRSVIVDAAADAHRTVRLIKILGQSSDHPILPAVPETEYLKGMLLEVMC